MTKLPPDADTTLNEWDDVPTVDIPVSEIPMTGRTGWVPKKVELITKPTMDIVVESDSEDMEQVLDAAICELILRRDELRKRRLGL